MHGNCTEIGIIVASQRSQTAPARFVLAVMWCHLLGPQMQGTKHSLVFFIHACTVIRAFKEVLLSGIVTL